MLERVRKAMASWGVLAVVFGLASYMWYQHHVDAQSEVPEAAREVPQWRSLLERRSPFLGVSSAKVSILEFSDYQCPYCKLEEDHLTELVSKHPTDVAVYRFDLPHPDLHPHSVQAAIAASCAEDQGVMEPYQYKLFQHQRDFAHFDWRKAAYDAGVRDPQAFERCIAGPANSRIARDLAWSKTFRFSGTPTLIISGTVIEGAVSTEQLEHEYSSAMKRLSNDGFMRWKAKSG